MNERKSLIYENTFINIKILQMNLIFQIMRCGKKIEFLNLILV